MIVEMARIVFGVALVCFHRPIAEFMHIREQELTTYLAQRGWRLPTFPSVGVTTNVYFCLSVAVFLLAVVRLWLPV